MRGTISGVTLVIFGLISVTFARNEGRENEVSLGKNEIVDTKDSQRREKGKSPVQPYFFWLW